MFLSRLRKWAVGWNSPSATSRVCDEEGAGAPGSEGPWSNEMCSHFFHSLPNPKLFFSHFQVFIHFRDYKMRMMVPPPPSPPLEDMKEVLECVLNGEIHLEESIVWMQILGGCAPSRIVLADTCWGASAKHITRIISLNPPLGFRRWGPVITSNLHPGKLEQRKEKGLSQDLGVGSGWCWRETGFLSPSGLPAASQSSIVHLWIICSSYFISSQADFFLPSTWAH